MDELRRKQVAGEDEDKAVDYEYAHLYVRPAIGADRFDSIVKPPSEREPSSEK